MEQLYLIPNFIKNRGVIMKNAVIYIHGKDGNSVEAEHYKKFFNKADIIGFEYTSEYPWDFQKEFYNYFLQFFQFFFQHPKIFWIISSLVFRTDK